MSIGDVAACRICVCVCVCVYCVPSREVGRLSLPTSLLGTQYDMLPHHRWTYYHFLTSI